MEENKNESTPVTRFLDNAGYDYKFFKHKNKITNLTDAAVERGQKPDQIIRSIVFHLKGGDYIMVLVAGLQQLSWPALRAYLGISRMTMASKEEVKEVTSYPIGAVSPLGLSTPLRILVDRSVVEGMDDEISFGSGVRNTTIIMKREDFLNALGEIEVGDFT